MSLGIAKVKVDGFGVADMKDPVGFGGKPGDHLTPRDAEVLLEEVHSLRSDHVAFRFVVLP